MLALRGVTSTSTLAGSRSAAAGSKTKRRQAVDVDETAAALLAEHQSRCLADAVGRSIVAPGAFVFANDTGRRAAWKPNWATKTFLRYQRQDGLRSVPAHDLRHFMATQMLDLGILLTVVARRLDHRRVATTLDFYGHVITGRDRFAADALAAVVHPATADHRNALESATSSTPSNGEH